MKAKKYKFIPTLKQILGFSSITTAILLWYIISMASSPLFVPSPKEVFIDSYQLYKGIVGMSILSTLYRVIIGFTVGTILGAVAGIAMSWNKIIRWIMDPIVEFLRPLPAIALIPLFILWIGLGESSRLPVIIFASFVVVVVSTREAIKNVPNVYINAAKTLGASNKGLIFKTIIIPAITPGIIGGIKIAAAASFDLAAAAEFIGAQRGIGYIIINAKKFLYTNGIVFGIFLFSLLAMVTNLAIRYFDRRVNIWTEREKA